MTTMKIIAWAIVCACACLLPRGAFADPSISRLPVAVTQHHAEGGAKEIDQAILQALDREGVTEVFEIEQWDDEGTRLVAASFQKRSDAAGNCLASRADAELSTGAEGVEVDSMAIFRQVEVFGCDGGEEAWVNLYGEPDPRFLADGLRDLRGHFEWIEARPRSRHGATADLSRMELSDLLSVRAEDNTLVFTFVPPCSEELSLKWSRGVFQVSASRVECFEQATVAISEVTPPIEILPGRDRRDSIGVLVPIDCDSGAARVPGNVPEAIAWLDIALPVDLKAALLHGDYAEPYATSPYGSSVMSDLFRYFSDRWNLGPDHPVCDSEDVKSRIANDDGPCFFVLVDLLRERYLAGAARDTPAPDRSRTVGDDEAAGAGGSGATPTTPDDRD